MGCESHLDDSYFTSEVFPSNFTIYRKDRCVGGGGVFVAISDDLRSLEDPVIDVSAELVWAKLCISGMVPMYICAFYRPPNSDVEPIVQLRKFLNSLFNGKSGIPHVVLTGDFNLPDILWTDDGGEMQSNPSYGNPVNSSFLEMLDDFNLSQLVMEPTRSNNVLDLFLTSQPSTISDIAIIPGMSDHEAITSKLTIGNKRPTTAKRKVYLYHKANLDEIKTRLQSFCDSFLSSNPNERSVEENWTLLKQCLLDTIDDLVPTKRIKNHQNLPWVNKNIRHKIKKRKRLYDRAKSTGNPSLWAQYKQIKNEITANLRTAHDAYCGHLFDSSNHKRFWSYVKKLRSNYSNISTIRCQNKVLTSSIDKANALNQQFLSVFTQEDPIIPTLPPNQLPETDNITFTSNGIKRILENLDPSKSAGPDNIPTRILKLCAAEISPVLQIIFSQSFQNGLLPSDWLHGNVIPIHKRGDRTVPANYRPISLTSVCCKVMEHIVYHSIMSHLEQNNILNPLQHGFRTGHSCTTQLLTVVEELAKSLDDRKQVDVLFLDFAKAFDTVPHQRLLLKLQSYGIAGRTHQWISQWLTKRTQRVVVNGTESDYVGVISGVPQGTVLGPLMFLLYINDISENILSTIRLFADDCIMYRSINSSGDTSILQRDLDEITNWANKWQLKFNVSKCVLVRVTRNHSQFTDSYTLNNQTIQLSDTYKYLGVILNNTLSWNTHITNVTNRATRMLNFVKRNLGKCTSQVKSKAYTSLVRPILEYATQVWDPHQKSLTHKIEMIQRRAARWVYSDYDYSSSVSTMLNELNWPTLEDRRKDARLSLLHRIINHQEPALEIPPYYLPQTSSTRRSSTQNFILPTSNTLHYQSNYFYRTIKEWNELPPATL